MRRVIPSIRSYHHSTIIRSSISSSVKILGNKATTYAAVPSIVQYHRSVASVANVQIFEAVGKPFVARQLAIPKLATGELLVRTTLATICGSDLHTVSGTRTEPTPLVLGHEGVGIVEAIGDGVSSLTRRTGGRISVGDRITWSIADSCGVCIPCATFEFPHKCTKLFKYGHAATSNGSGLNGSYGSHVLLRANTHVVVIPPHVPDNFAAPANCALATIANTLDAAELPRKGPRETAVVQGAGLLGIYACAWLKYRLGFKHVWCVDRNEYRVPYAAYFGATPIVAGKDDFPQRLAQVQKIAPHGVDVVVEVTGSPAVVPEGIKLLRFGGHYAFAGMVHPNTRLDNITGEEVIRRCITIRGSHNYAPQHLDEAVSFLSDHTATTYPGTSSVSVASDFTSSLSTISGKRALPFQVLVSQPYALKDIAVAIEEAHKHTWARVSVHFNQ